MGLEQCSPGMVGTRGVYREPAQGRLCSGQDCDHPATSECVRCQAPICRTHALEGGTLCQACAEYELLRVNHAGKRSLVTVGTIAMVLALLTALTAQVVQAKGSGVELPAVMVMALVAVFGCAVVAGIAARPLARRRVRKERALPRDRREVLEAQFRKRLPGLKKIEARELTGRG